MVVWERSLRWKSANHDSATTRACVDSRSIPKCTRESIAGRTFRATMALDLANAAVVVAHSGHGSEAGVGLFDAHGSGSVETQSRSSHAHNFPIGNDGR